MHLSKEQFLEVFPKAISGEDLYDSMVKLFPKYDITTPEREAGFLAQCGHESGGFRIMVENLNYSASGLERVFSKYFSKAGRDANEYAGQPEKIANIVYANRMSNGDTESGDGYRFRGHGFIQLTGRYNFTEFGKDTDMTAEEAVEYAKTLDGALETALWFWKTNNLNKYADRKDIRGMTKRINGGYNGLKDREHHWTKLLNMLGVEEREEFIEIRTLRMGDRGEDVKELQRKLSVRPISGVFGPTTRRAVLKFQRDNNLTADGIVGPKTRAKLG